jgi:molecular chaperone HtpG
VVNPNHPLVVKISEELYSVHNDSLKANSDEKSRLKEEISFMEKEQKSKKADEISQVEKDDLEKLRKELTDTENRRRDLIESYGTSSNTVKQLIDLALLANNMLRGEQLSSFVKRSVDLL